MSHTHVVPCDNPRCYRCGGSGRIMGLTRIGGGMPIPVGMREFRCPDCNGKGCSAPGEPEEDS